MDGNKQNAKAKDWNALFFTVVGHLSCNYVVKMQPDEAHCEHFAMIRVLICKCLSVYAFTVNALYLCNIMIDKNVKGCIFLCNVCCCH